jgi:ribonuclease-3
MSLPPFKNRSLLLRALTHRSYLNEHTGAGEDNERLEFLGDAVMDFLSAAFLYHRYPEMKEGGLTRMRAALVKTEHLASLAEAVSLGSQLRLGKGEEESGGRQRASLLCDAFEAMIGAYFLDAGLKAVQDYVEPLFAAAADHILRGEKDVDAKSQFQEWAQATLGKTPRYRFVSESGPDHQREYAAEVLVGDEVYGMGTGRSKSNATQAAAQAALQRVERE